VASVVRLAPMGGTAVAEEACGFRIGAEAEVLDALNFSAFELPHFIMQRRMMLRIKELAERGGEARG